MVNKVLLALLEATVIVVVVVVDFVVVFDIIVGPVWGYTYTIYIWLWSIKGNLRLLKYTVECCCCVC